MLSKTITDIFSEVQDHHDRLRNYCALLFVNVQDIFESNNIHLKVNDIEYNENRMATWFLEPIQLRYFGETVILKRISISIYNDGITKIYCIIDTNKDKDYRTEFNNSSSKLSFTVV